MMINELKSERVLISLVICVLAAQIPHAQGVWYHASAQTLLFDWSHLWTWCCAWLFAFGLEFSTLMQVIRGRHLLSYVFALISVFINLFYFQIVTDLRISELPMRYGLLSVILPLAIASYSHLCAANVQEPHAATHGSLSARVRSFWLHLDALWPHWLRRPQRITTPHTSSSSEIPLDERESAVLDAVRRGASSVYAIAKATNINASTLRRKTGEGAYTGLVEQLIQAGLLADDGGAIVIGQ